MRFLSLVSLLFSFALNGETKNNAPCGAEEHWVRPHHRRAYVRGDGTPVKAAEVEGHCQKNPGGYAIWNPKLRDGKPQSWQPDNEKISQWTAEERERVLEALEETPAFLKDPNIDGIYRLKEATHPGNPASNDYADIVLYDNAFDPPFVLTHVLDHELGHRLFENLSESDKRSFRSAAGWTTDKTGRVLPGRPEGQFLRKNGMLSVPEDFADDAAAYAQEPSKLRRTAPRIYDWFKGHFGNKLKNRGKR